jgi:hypothetical protein
MNATHNDLDLWIKLKRIQILFKFKLYGVTRSHFLLWRWRKKKWLHPLLRWSRCKWAPTKQTLNCVLCSFFCKMKLCFLWYLYTVHVTFLCSKQGLIVGSQVIFHPGPATRFCIVEFHELCKLMSYWFLLFSKIVFLVIFETRYSDANCVWRGTHRKASLAGARCHRTACTIYTLRYVCMDLL